MTTQTIHTPRRYCRQSPFPTLEGALERSYPKERSQTPSTHQWVAGSIHDARQFFQPAVGRAGTFLTISRNAERIWNKEKSTRRISARWTSGRRKASWQSVNVDLRTSPSSQNMSDPC